MAIFKKGQTWYIDYYVEGKRRREAVGQSRKMAERALAKRKVQVAENRFLEVARRSKASFEQLVDQYMEYAKVNKLSWERDQRSIKVLGRWFSGKQLFEVTPLQVERFKTHRRKEVGPAAVNRELACLKHMFTKAIQWEMATSNPVKLVKLLREDNARLRYLTEEEIVRLYTECSEHLKPIILVALYTGMRKSEILQLKWSDVDFDNRLIHIRDSKSGEPRKIPISSTVFRTLALMKINGPFVFAKRSGDNRKDLRTAFANALKRAEISQFRFHDLRHTFASHLVMNSVDLLTVKELLGHKSIDMTLRYSHLSPSHKRKAVESLELIDGHYLDTKEISPRRFVARSACETRDAEVVKLVDTLRSGRSSRMRVGVRVPPSAFSLFLTH